MAGWEQSDESDVSDGEPCPFCGGLGHSVDDCPMRRDAKGEVVKEQRPDPVARLVDVVADAVLDTADENLSDFLARLAANGLRAQRYNDLVSELVPGICADAAFDPEVLASKFEVDPEGLLLLRETVRGRSTNCGPPIRCTKTTSRVTLSPEQLSSFSSAKDWDDDDTREMLREPPPPPPPPQPRTVRPGPRHPRLRGPDRRRRRRRRPRRGLLRGRRAAGPTGARRASLSTARRLRAPRAGPRGGRRQMVMRRPPGRHRLSGSRRPRAVGGAGGAEFAPV